MMRTRQIQGLSWASVWRFAPAFLAALGLAWVLLSAPAPVLGEQNDNSTVTNENPQKRRDNVFGTTDEGIRTGRDPSTGDSVITVTPPERPWRPKYPLPPVLVEPKVELPAGNQKKP